MAKNTAGSPPNSSQLKKYNVTQPGMRDVVGQPLYDTQVYPAGGVTELNFFQTGQANRSPEDTNLQGPGGFLPDPNNQLVDSIWIELIAPAALKPAPDISAAGVVSQLTNDFWTLANGGVLTFSTLNKQRLQLAPLKLFPSPARVNADVALAMSSDIAAPADHLAQIQLPYLVGKVQPVYPKVRLMPTQAFIVSLNWKVAPTLSADWKIKVYLGGLYYRAVQ